MALQDFAGDTPNIRVLDLFLSNTLWFNEPSKKNGFEDMVPSYTITQIAHFADVPLTPCEAVVLHLVEQGLIEESPSAPELYCGDPDNYKPEPTDKTYRLRNVDTVHALHAAILLQSGMYAELHPCNPCDCESCHCGCKIKK